ncbi:hypothetical protein M2161_005105 [Streptomyces sp. SAI-133]|nr:hypothetical protein [Streptomyces sp. SAI-133]
MRKHTHALTAGAMALGLATAGLVTAVPATAAPAPAPRAGYTAATTTDTSEAFFQAVLASVAEKRAAHPDSTAAVTVVYDASRAPSFSAQISRSAQIWNSSVSNVRLQSGSASSADFSYREGNDSRVRTPRPTVTAAGMSSWTTARTSSTTRPVSPPTRPDTCSVCRTTTPVRAVS